MASTETVTYSKLDLYKVAKGDLEQSKSILDGLKGKLRQVLMQQDNLRGMVAELELDPEVKAALAAEAEAAAAAAQAEQAAENAA